MHRHLVPKLVGAVVLLATLGGGAASAFTNSNVVPQSFAGEGVGVVSGYYVTNLHYTVSNNPSTTVMGNDANISGVTFTLSAPATTVGYALYDSHMIGTGNTGVVGGGQCYAEAQSSTVPANTWQCYAAQATNGNGGGWAPVYQVTGIDITASN